MVRDLPPISFIPVADLAAAEAFYRDVVGVEIVRTDGFALVARTGGQLIRIVEPGPEFIPQPFTILGWESPDIRTTVRTLADRGVVFHRYDQFDQDEDGIWAAPGGDQVAWFSDPWGNTLSISQHASR